MTMTSRERVTRALTFAYPDRIPREMWALPWATSHYPIETNAITQSFPGDFGAPDNPYNPSPRAQGDSYAVGESTDEWGCHFTNIQAGVIGEVRKPLVDIADWRQLTPPYELLPENYAYARDIVNKSCANSNQFIRALCNPRPWERLQFILGSENAYLEIMNPEDGAEQLLKIIHDFHMTELEFWVSTDVDGISFMDDWGAQQQLLIPPSLWRALFKPLYRDYCDLAHAHNKFVFMHSDGYISEIYPDLIEIGVDALNSQLFVMDMAELAAVAKGKITFWGEIDRQHIMPAKDSKAGRDAVRKVASHLYQPSGGIIAEFELGPGSNPEVGMAIFDEWEKLVAEQTIADEAK